jgi:hypothetical protein
MPMHLAGHLFRRGRTLSDPVTAREKAVEPAPQTKLLAGMRVLAVDDNDVNLALIGRLLLKSGAEGVNAPPTAGVSVGVCVGGGG